ncbi:hypothetical protein [Falsibacillus pallidus]|uniref:Uncharacterized protein n=1 Tax=Falsibacillus pallidus TaxID=493781 RepID=A0A370G5N1_9BACI|nr:hypothetical protein [Falsibacillus pallidus]RDI39128.1 hypothetical protein DFR59_11535 [Falsibacillus pallidus]
MSKKLALVLLTLMLIGVVYGIISSHITMLTSIGILFGVVLVGFKKKWKLNS